MSDRLEEFDVTALARRIIAAGGAIHPDVAPRGGAGLLIVAPTPELVQDSKLAHVGLATYFAAHPTDGLLETSRRVLWARMQALLEQKWRAVGAPALTEDAVRSQAWDLLDDIWREARRGRRLTEFPAALKKLRSAMLKYFSSFPSETR